MVLLAVFGIVGLASLGFRSQPADFSTLYRQLFALGIGAVLAIVAARVDWRAWERWWPAVAVALAVLLLGVLLVGTRVRGTRGWFTIDGFTLQPVEFAKVGLILLQAIYFRRRARLLDRFRTVAESGALTAAVIIPILLQPDLGSALLMVMTWLGMLAVFGLQRRHLRILVIAALAVAVIGWQFSLQPYQRARVRTVLDPRFDPQGAGYNQLQATIAVGAGGILGRGFGQGTQAQLRFLPEAQSDFLPAVLAEEFGFLGIAALLACIAVILWRLTVLARRCPDDTAAAIVVGYGILFGSQTLLNLAMNLGVAPVIGIPFPFVSAGGSAVLAFAFGLGVVLSIAMRTPRVERQAYERDVSDEAFHAVVGGTP